MTELDDPYGLPASAAINPDFARLHAYWRGKVTQDRLPGRADIDPLQIPRDLMAELALLDVVGDGAARRYRFRLLGSGVAQVTGREYTGRYYDEVVEPQGWAALAAVLHETVERRRPGFLLSRSGAPGRGFLMYARLVLPLASDGRRVDMLLGMMRVIPEAAD